MDGDDESKTHYTHYKGIITASDNCKQAIYIYIYSFYILTFNSRIGIAQNMLINNYSFYLKCDFSILRIDICHITNYPYTYLSVRLAVDTFFYCLFVRLFPFLYIALLLWTICPC